MIKIIKYLILFFFLQISSVFASCLTDKADFGSSLNDLRNKTRAIVMPFTPKSFELFVPGRVICENNVALEGTGITYLFLDDKLVEIKGEDFYSNNLGILKWLEKEFGIAEDKPKNISTKSKVAHLHWDKDNFFVFYQMEKTNEGTREFFKITSQRFKNEFEDYGKQLDEIR